MYGKLFAQMYDGTLATKGPWQALVTFQQLVILADPEGVVDMTVESVARRTTIPLEIIEAGIGALELPDPASRTPAEEGRRIVRLSDTRPWGWRIVNYGFYRNIRNEIERRDKRREYHKEYARSRRKSRQQPINNSQQLQLASTGVNGVTPSSKKKKETTSAKSGGWVGRFLTALTDVTKGTYPAGRLGSDLKELIDGKGQDPVYAAWLVFLAGPDRKYGPSYFAKNYVDYSEPNRNNGQRPGETPQEYQFRKRGYVV